MREVQAYGPPVTYIKAGTEYPARAWGGYRPGAGRPRVVK